MNIDRWFHACSSRRQSSRHPEEGRLEGREEGLEACLQQEAGALIRQLSRCFGGLDEGTRVRLSSLTLQQPTR